MRAAIGLCNTLQLGLGQQSLQAVCLRCLLLYILQPADHPVDEYPALLPSSAPQCWVRWREGSLGRWLFPILWGVVVVISSPFLTVNMEEGEDNHLHSVYYKRCKHKYSPGVGGLVISIPVSLRLTSYIRLHKRVKHSAFFPKVQDDQTCDQHHCDFCHLFNAIPSCYHAKHVRIFGQVWKLEKLL